LPCTWTTPESITDPDSSIVTIRPRRANDGGKASLTRDL
jgi:hypothetical protein